MRELKGFIKGLVEMDYGIVSIGEVFSDEVELICIDDLQDRIKDIGFKEVVAEYYESFEFFTSDGKYIEINGVY